MKKLFKGEFAYIKNAKYMWMVSGALLLVCLLINLILGTSVDITFKGGTLVKFAYEGELTEDAVQDFIAKEFDFKALDVQSAEASAPGGESYKLMNMYTTDVLSTEQVTALNNAMTQNFKDNKVTQDSTNSIQATVGKLFFLKCMVAVVLAAVFLLLYVGIRFRKIGGWPAGAMAMVAILHDICFAYFAFVIFRIPLNDNFVAVVLTILGYSLNDTIVVYDRIRENRSLKTSLAEVADISLNQTFMRNTNTFLSTFIAISTVAVVALVSGLEAITSFAVPMMVGVLAGFYSSTFLCIPAWVKWSERREAKKAEKFKEAKVKEKGKKKTRK